VFSDSDAYGGNAQFKIKIKPLSNDLAGNKGKGNDEPRREFADGDIVKGIGDEDKQEHEGRVISSKFDEDSGECLSVNIEEDGRIFSLAPASIKMVQDNGSYNDEDGKPSAPASTNLDTVSAYTFERLKPWSEFDV